VSTEFCKAISNRQLAVAWVSKCYNTSADLSKRLLHNHVSIHETENEMDTLQLISFPVTKRLAETTVLMSYIKFYVIMMQG
jgi:hypothetical protein